MDPLTIIVCICLATVGLLLVAVVVTLICLAIVETVKFIYKYFKKK